MHPDPAPTRFRSRGGAQAAKVGMVELFFDLVFVFAITQLSHTLLQHLSPLGALHTAMLLLAVWSLWHYTCWATNALDPERMPVRLLLFVLMLAGLVLSMSIPSAFGGGGWTFAAAYVLMHSMRCLFLLWAARDQPPQRRRSYWRNLFWVGVAAVPWLAGAAAAPEARLPWWLGAVAIELISPWLLYWTPGLGASKTGDWVISGEHMAERCALFVIIALGESLLITGATFAGEAPSVGSVAGFGTAFFATVAMWWIYFHEGAEHAAHHIARSADPGRAARIAYSYLHIAIVGGILVAAVGDEIVLVDPGHAEAAAVATVIGGAALFLCGCMGFKWVSHERKWPPLSHGVGLLALAALAAAAAWLTTLQLAIATAAVLTMVAAWEALALRRPRSAAAA